MLFVPWQGQHKNTAQPRCTRSNTPSRRNNNACTSIKYKLLPCLLCVRDVTNTSITLANQWSLFRVGRSLLSTLFCVLCKRSLEKKAGPTISKKRLWGVDGQAEVQWLVQDGLQTMVFLNTSSCSDNIWSKWWYIPVLSSYFLDNALVFLCLGFSGIWEIG